MTLATGMTSPAGGWAIDSAAEIAVEICILGAGRGRGDRTRTPVWSVLWPRLPNKNRQPGRRGLVLSTIDGVA
jgi:hypothetical protein